MKALLQVSTELHNQGTIRTVRVVFDNLDWERGIELFRVPAFREAYTDFLLSFTRGNRTIAQYGHMGLDVPFLDWLTREGIAYLPSMYSFAHLGDWAYELKDGSFEVVFEPPPRLLPDLLHNYAPTDHLALIIVNPSVQSPLREISGVLTVPNAADTVANRLLPICEWLILTEDDGETVVIKSGRQDAPAVVEDHLAPIRRALM